MMNILAASARVCVLAVLVLLTAQSIAAQGGGAYRIAYVISMPRPESHLFEVRVDVEGLSGAAHVDFQMPRWSPGRYAVFAKSKTA